MKTISLEDKYLVDNFKAIQELKTFGYSDEEIQELYNKQVEKDHPTEKGGASDA